jgi:hypothetical protein
MSKNGILTVTEAIQALIVPTTIWSHGSTHGTKHEEENLNMVQSKQRR